MTNEFEIQQARARYSDHPVLAPATETLSNLAKWTNQNSDGWAYWPKPCRAAEKLMALIEGDRTNSWDTEREDATVDAFKKALTPIKTFRTKHGADFDVVAA